MCLQRCYEIFAKIIESIVIETTSCVARKIINLRKDIYKFLLLFNKLQRTKEFRKIRYINKSI